MTTTTFTVDAIGDPEPITVSVTCRYVKIRVQGGLGNTAFTIYSADDSTGARSGSQYPAGGEVVFTRRHGQAAFRNDEVVGYVEITSGTATFSMECE